MKIIGKIVKKNYKGIYIQKGLKVDEKTGQRILTMPEAITSGLAIITIANIKYAILPLV